MSLSEHDALQCVFSTRLFLLGTQLAMACQAETFFTGARCRASWAAAFAGNHLHEGFKNTFYKENQ